MKTLTRTLATCLLAGGFWTTTLHPASQTGAAEPAEKPLRAIRHGDVVFMYDTPSMVEPYGCTVLGWGGHADREHIRQAREAGVRQFSVSVGWLTEFAGMIDFSDDFQDATARNLAGEPFIVPWLWDHKHKGQPAWWFCTNAPLYRQFLETRLEHCMAAMPDGLHIDDFRGSSGTVTWRSGCFCRHCMAAFREYLRTEVPPEKLKELGIDDLGQFDYREFLLARGVKPEEYNARRSGLPLAEEFYDFHVRANNAYIAEYRKKAEQLRGGPVTLSVNSCPSDPQSLAVAPQLSYFCCEVHHGAESLQPATHPIAVYKLADGLDRPVASTASGQDWAFISEQNKPCLVRTWAALSYAMGHNLMAPHRQWCYTEQKGTHWYAGPTEEYAWLYRFVRDQARLLDDYDAVAPIAVVYDNAANKHGQGRIEPICIALAERNLPFTVAVAGDNWLDYRLSAEQLAGYRVVIAAAEPTWMDAEQRQVLDAVAQSGRLISWPDDDRLTELVGQPVQIVGSDRVMAVPRAVPDKADAPPVVHLLNRAYDGPADTMIPQKDFTLRVAGDLFMKRNFSKAVLHAPREEPVTLPVTGNGDFLDIQVPQLDLWGIVELLP